MLRQSFLWRLYAGYGGLVLLLTLLVGFQVLPGLRRAYEQDVQRSLEAQAALLAELAQPYLAELASSSGEGDGEVFERPAVREMRASVERLAESSDTRFTLVLPDGTVLADSHEDPASMENHRTRPELRESRLQGHGVSIRYSRTLRTEMMYFARGVSVRGELLGLARTSVSLAEIDARIAKMRNDVLLSAGIALLVSLVGGWLLARRITHPLRIVTAAVKSMRAGEYGRRIHVDSMDEIGTLAIAFNEMGEELQDHLETIQGDRNKTHAILAAMKEGVIAVDPDEYVLHLNRAAGELLRIDPESSIGRHVWEVVRVTDVCRSITETIRAGEPRAIETRIPGTDRDRILELQSSVLRDGSGAAAGAVLVLHDVSELRRLEGVRKDFVSNVSHELKTPLTAISGLIESILDDPAMDGGTRSRFLLKVAAQARRLSDLVQDLLSLARVERQNGQRERVEIDLRHGLEASIEALTPLFEEKPLSLHQEIEDVPLLVRADEESVRQIFDNLLSNAARYTPGGGNIHVRARREGEDLVVEIEDTGIGIEPRHLERIFERFYRVDSARSRELGGTGLGLSIVKHVVLGLGGDVQVESRPGEGSLFRVVLPRAGGTG